MKDPELRKKKKQQFESLNVRTIKAIQHSDALAVWVLLSCMPDNWRVNRIWLRRQLGIGKDRLNGAIKRLKALGIWWTEAQRDEKTGRLSGSEIWIGDEVDPPSDRFSGMSENQTVGNPATTHYKGCEPNKKQQLGSGGDIADAANGKVVSEPIFPKNLLPHAESLASTMTQIPEENRSAFLYELSQAVNEGKVKTTPVRYAVGMVKKGWQPDTGVTEKKEADALSSMMTELRKGWEGGATLLLNGEPVHPAPWPQVLIDDGLMNIAHAIRLGARVELRA